MSQEQKEVKVNEFKDMGTLKAANNGLLPDDPFLELDVAS